MKIVISHVYSNHNKGDAALLSVLISDIKKAFSNPEITILSLDKIQEGEKFDGEKVLNSFMYFARDWGNGTVSKAFFALVVLLYTFAWAVLYRFFRIDFKINSRIYKTIEAYKNSDLIITVGGGYIRSQPGFKGTLVLLFILHPILFTYILGKTTVGYSQSIGPFGGEYQEAMAKYVVKKMDAVIVREKISQKLLEKWGVTKNVFLSVDSGFQFSSESSNDVRKSFGLDFDKKIVGVTVRKWLDTEKQNKYETDVAKLCDYIIKKYGAKIVFIPQVTVSNHNDDDRVCSKSVYEKMSEKSEVVVLNENFDHNSIKSIYNSLDYLIGTRFHSVIFSLTSRVPSIAIQYEHKTRGIMRELDLEKWVIDIDKTDEMVLEKMFDDLVLDRKVYLETLNRNLPPYIAEAQKTIFIVKEIYDNKIM
jgi:colanic acid/amylovoran biosynthesis protein